MSVRQRVASSAPFERLTAFAFRLLERRHQLRDLLRSDDAAAAPCISCLLLLSLLLPGVDQSNSRTNRGASDEQDT